MQIKNISGKYLPGDKSTSISVFTNIKIIRSDIGQFYNLYLDLLHIYR